MKLQPNVSSLLGGFGLELVAQTESTLEDSQSVHAELDHSARHKEVSKTFPYAQKDRATPLPSTLQCALVSQPTEQCFVDFVGLLGLYTGRLTYAKLTQKYVVCNCLSGWLGYDLFFRQQV